MGDPHQDDCGLTAIQTRIIAIELHPPVGGLKGAGEGIILREKVCGFN
jgi:hypothetical protein